MAVGVLRRAVLSSWALAVGLAVAALGAPVFAVPDGCPLPERSRIGEIWWNPCPDGEPETALALPLPAVKAEMIFLSIDEPYERACGASDVGGGYLAKYELTVGEAAAILAGDPETGVVATLADGLQALADLYDDGEGRGRTPEVEPLLWRLRSLSFGVWNTPEGGAALSVLEHLARPVVGLTPAELEALADHYTAWCYRDGACRARLAAGGETRLIRLPSGEEWRRAAGEIEAAAEPAFDDADAKSYANLGRMWSEPRAAEAVIGLGRAPTGGGFFDLYGNAAELTNDRSGARLALGGSFDTAPEDGVGARETVAPYAFDQASGAFLGAGRSLTVGARLAVAAIQAGGSRRPECGPLAAAPESPHAPALADQSVARSEIDPQQPRSAGDAGDGDAALLRTPSTVEASGLRAPPDPSAEMAGLDRMRDAAREGRLEEEARLRGVEADALRTRLRDLEAEAQSLRNENQSLAGEAEELRAAAVARRTRLCAVLAENMFLSARFQLRYWRQFYKLEPILAELESVRSTDPAYYDELIARYSAQKTRIEALSSRVFARYLRTAEAIAEQGESCAAEGFSSLMAMGLDGEPATEDAPKATGAETMAEARAHAIEAARRIEGGQGEASEDAIADPELAEKWRREFMDRGRQLAAAEQ